MKVCERCGANDIENAEHEVMNQLSGSGEGIELGVWCMEEELCQRRARKRELT